MMNAADALSVTEREGVRAADKTLRIRSVREGDCIALSFEDNGTGISEEELSRIFDPFFTTKEPGKGTGLGLSVCYRIIEGMGGSIRAESSPGKGTAITVILPLYEPETDTAG
jgi:signal transduction histidine kinase